MVKAGLPADLVPTRSPSFGDQDRRLNHQCDKRTGGQVQPNLRKLAAT